MTRAPGFGASENFRALAGGFVSGAILDFCRRDFHFVCDAA